MGVKQTVFEINATSAEWVIDHNLQKYVVSDVYIFDSLDRLVKILPLSVENETLNRIRIKFSTAMRGLVKVK